jgi:hypothetical protein
MKIARPLSLLLLLLIILYAGYQFGRNSNKPEGNVQLIENYSFVREIAELASLEANGVSTFKTTNLANDGSWTDALRKKFLENTVQISVPYTAKYGVDLKDSAMRIVRKDSIVEIHLPQPRLLSYELRLDRMETTSQSGWLLSPSDERYTELQKKLYTQSRAQLEANSLYLIDSRQRICTILEQYFLTLKLKSVCIFDMPSPVIDRPKG